MRKNCYWLLLLPLALGAFAPRSAHADASVSRAQQPVWRSPVGPDSTFLPFSDNLVARAGLGLSFVLQQSSFIRWPSRIFVIDPAVAAAIARDAAGTTCSLQAPSSPGRLSQTSAAGCTRGTIQVTATDVSLRAADEDQADTVTSGFAMGFGAGYGVPTLLHYNGTTKSRPDLALSVTPGGPCIGACLKLAGSF